MNVTFGRGNGDEESMPGEQRAPAEVVHYRTYIIRFPSKRPRKSNAKLKAPVGVDSDYLDPVLPCTKNKHADNYESLPFRPSKQECPTVENLWL